MMSDKNIQTVYSVKYALTTGICLMSGFEREDGGFMSTNDGYYYQSHSKTDWSRTGLEALALAEAMRVKKQASLEKQIKKIKDMEFKLPNNGP